MLWTGYRRVERQHQPLPPLSFLAMALFGGGRAADPTNCPTSETWEPLGRHRACSPTFGSHVYTNLANCKQMCLDRPNRECGAITYQHSGGACWLCSDASSLWDTSNCCTGHNRQPFVRPGFCERRPTTAATTTTTTTILAPHGQIRPRRRALPCTASHTVDARFPYAKPCNPEKCGTESCTCHCCGDEVFVCSYKGADTKARQWMEANNCDYSKQYRMSEPIEGVRIGPARSGSWSFGNCSELTTCDAEGVAVEATQTSDRICVSTTTPRTTTTTTTTSTASTCHARVHKVRGLDGHYYAALDDVNVAAPFGTDEDGLCKNMLMDDGPNAKYGSSCQSTPCYLPIPDGWSIAEDTDAALDVIRTNRFSTFAMVVRSAAGSISRTTAASAELAAAGVAKAYGGDTPGLASPDYTPTPGAVWAYASGVNRFAISKDSYATSHCHQRILIRCNYNAIYAPFRCDTHTTWPQATAESVAACEDTASRFNNLVGVAGYVRCGSYEAVDNLLMCDRNIAINFTSLKIPMYCGLNPNALKTTSKCSNVIEQLNAMMASSTSTSTSTSTSSETRTGTSTPSITATSSQTSIMTISQTTLTTAAASEDPSNALPGGKKQRSGGVGGGIVGSILVLAGAGIAFVMWRRRQDSSGSSSCITRLRQASFRTQQAAFEEEEVSRNTFPMVSNPASSVAMRANAREHGEARNNVDITNTGVYYSTVAETRQGADGYVVDDSSSPSGPVESTLYATYAATEGTSNYAEPANGAANYAELATAAANYSESAPAREYAAPSDLGQTYMVPLQHGGVAYATGVGGSGTPAVEVYANANDAAATSSA